MDLVFSSVYFVKHIDFHTPSFFYVAVSAKLTGDDIILQMLLLNFFSLIVVFFNLFFNKLR